MAKMLVIPTKEGKKKKSLPELREKCEKLAKKKKDDAAAKRCKSAKVKKADVEELIETLRKELKAAKEEKKKKKRIAGKKEKKEKVTTPPKPRKEKTPSPQKPAKAKKFDKEAWSLLHEAFEEHGTRLDAQWHDLAEKTSFLRYLREANSPEELREVFKDAMDNAFSELSRVSARVERTEGGEWIFSAFWGGSELHEYKRVNGRGVVRFSVNLPDKAKTKDAIKMLEDIIGVRAEEIRWGETPSREKTPSPPKKTPTPPKPRKEKTPSPPRKTPSPQKPAKAKKVLLPELRKECERLAKVKKDDASAKQCKSTKLKKADVEKLIKELMVEAPPKQKTPPKPSTPPKPEKKKKKGRPPKEVKPPSPKKPSPPKVEKERKRPPTEKEETPLQKARRQCAERFPDHKEECLSKKNRAQVAALMKRLEEPRAPEKKKPSLEELIMECVSDFPTESKKCKAAKDKKELKATRSKLAKKYPSKRCFLKSDHPDYAACDDDELCDAKTGSCLKKKDAPKTRKVLLVDGREIMGDDDTLKSLQEILGGKLEEVKEVVAKRPPKKEKKVTIAEPPKVGELEPQVDQEKIRRAFEECLARLGE